MIDKKELISTYLQQFGSHYQISRLLNPTLRIDDEFISHFFEQVVDQYGETFAITEEEKTEIERKIKSQYCIFQDEGAALVGDYEHDFMWYANLQAQEDYDEYYWPRYKAHLENKNFSPAGIDTLENKTLPKLMSYIGNPNEDSPFSSLIPTLTAQQKETFEKLKDCEAELHGMNEREAFISGFKLAARIMTEVLCKPSED